MQDIYSLHYLRFTDIILDLSLTQEMSKDHGPDTN